MAALATSPPLRGSPWPSDCIILSEIIGVCDIQLLFVCLFLYNGDSQHPVLYISQNLSFNRKFHVQHQFVTISFDKCCFARITG